MLAQDYYGEDFLVSIDDSLNYAPAEITYDPTLWTGEQVGGEDYAPYTVTYDPALWTGDQVGGVSASGGSFLDIFKSIINTASPVVTSILRSGGSELPKGMATSTTSALPVKTVSGSLSGSLASVTSNPLLLIGLGGGGFMFLKSRIGKKSKRR